MSVLVDTSVWSLALRRRLGLSSGEQRYKEALGNLIREGHVSIIGPIRQELLSGLKSERQYRKLRDYLRYFEDIPLETRDHELAAKFYNRCRKNGIQGSLIDFLICAVAHRHSLTIYTLDKDFESCHKYLEIRLFQYGKNPY